ncbi:MAG: T4 RnlA family RNA ligase [Anaerolineales bacterium]|nr:T4 RnlA family RNA ligase [Anaerolineales bacterium]
MNKITEITSIEEIQQLAKSGFTEWKGLGDVSVERDGSLLIFNYTARAQYEGRWNFFERVSRGLIVHAVTGEIVARAFDKFYNWLQNGEKSNGHIVSITEKMDGSLGILYRLNGEHRISTRGNFHSDQAEYATKFLHEHYNLGGLPDELTLLFEIIYPENRVIVDYKGREDIVLIAARNRFTGAYLPFFPDLQLLADQYGFPLPKIYSFNNITEIIALTGKLDKDEEGFVVEFSDEQRFKFKGDKYLELHRLVFGLSFKNTLQAIVTKQVDYIREQIPDEFSADFNGWVKEIEETRERIKREAADIFAQAPKQARKDFAIWVMSNHKHLSAYLFAMLDGEDIEALIYKKAFENRPNEMAVKQSENTA